MVVQERYTPRIMSADSSLTLNGPSVAGFICTASGSVSITDDQGVAIVTAFPVTAGVFHPLPLFIGEHGGVITLSGGAVGTLLV